MIFEFAQDFRDAVAAMPREHPKRRMLELLEEAIRRDIHFIARHPTTLFQCLWNTCGWYDCTQAANHYEQPEGGSKEPPPWERHGPKISAVMEGWRRVKEDTMPGFPWVRSLRSPAVHLGTAQRAVIRGLESAVMSAAYSPDGRRIASGALDGTGVKLNARCCN